jgi:hypothetical protein
MKLSDTLSDMAKCNNHNPHENIFSVNTMNYNGLIYY